MVAPLVPRSEIGVHELPPRVIPAQISWYKMYVGIRRKKGVLLLVLFGVWRSMFWSALHTGVTVNGERISHNELH